MLDTFAKCGITRSFEDSPEKSVYVRRIENNEYITEFIFNCSDNTYSRAVSDVVTVGADAVIDNGRITVAKNSIGCFVINK